MRRTCSWVIALFTALPTGCLIAVPASAAARGPAVGLGDSLASGVHAEHRPGPDRHRRLAHPASPRSVHQRSVHEDESFDEIDLVSDIPGRAAVTDPNLVNSWGLSSSPNGPIFVSDNGTSKVTVYAGAHPDEPVRIVPTVVSIPGSGAPTGQVFNGTDGFKIGSDEEKRPAKHIFAGEDGDISAWNPFVSATDAIVVAHLDDAVYKGLALLSKDEADDPRHHGNHREPRLLAANFRAGRIDIFDERFGLLPPAGKFQDPDIPTGFAPFNVAVIDGSVFVTYAKQNPDKHDDVPGPGNGFIDEFDRDGQLLRRFASEDKLNSPWGLVLAPWTFSKSSAELLVGNFGDGRINVFDRNTGDFRGSLTHPDGTEIVIPGLWGLLRGTTDAGGRDAVWFAAGIDGEKHGLLGILRASEDPRTS